MKPCFFLSCSIEQCISFHMHKHSNRTISLRYYGCQTWGRCFKTRSQFISGKIKHEMELIWYWTLQLQEAQFSLTYFFVRCHQLVQIFLSKTLKYHTCLIHSSDALLKLWYSCPPKFSGREPCKFKNGNIEKSIFLQFFYLTGPVSPLNNTST